MIPIKTTNVNTSQLMKPTVSIFGAGLSGLSLTQAIQQVDPTQTIHLYDKKSKTELLQDPKTICFLEQSIGAFDHLLLKKWQTISINALGLSRKLSIAPYCYKLLTAKDLYAYYFHQFNEHVTLFEKNITSIPNNNDFDSTSLQVDYKQPTMTMLGATYSLSANTDCFEPDTITILDDRTKTKLCDFFFFMPFNKRQGYLQYVVYANQIHKENRFDQTVENYLSRLYPKAKIVVDKVGYDSPPIILGTPIPQTQAVHIGAKAGLVSPMTGFGFTHILKQTEQLAHHKTYDKPNFTLANAWLAITQKHGLFGKFMIQSSIFFPKSLLLKILS